MAAFIQKLLKENAAPDKFHGKLLREILVQFMLVPLEPKC